MIKEPKGMNGEVFLRAKPHALVVPQDDADVQEIPYVKIISLQ